MINSKKKFIISRYLLVSYLNSTDATISYKCCLSKWYTISVAQKQFDKGFYIDYPCLAYNTWNRAQAGSSHVNNMHC